LRDRRRNRRVEQGKKEEGEFKRKQERGDEDVVEGERDKKEQ